MLINTINSNTNFLSDKSTLVFKKTHENNTYKFIVYLCVELFCQVDCFQIFSKILKSIQINNSLTTALIQRLT